MKLDQIIKQVQIEEGESSNAKPLPPIEQWNPPFSGDLDMRIARNGAWFYLGSEIKRDALVKLFSSILLHENGEYFLVTPVEKFRIQVDDAPFTVISAEHTFVEDDSREQVPTGKEKERKWVSVWVCKTNVGDTVIVDAEHPLTVKLDEVTDEPSPYILVRSNLKALITRSVFYDLVEQAECEEGEENCLYILSCNERFELGRF